MKTTYLMWFLAIATLVGVTSWQAFNIGYWEAQADCVRRLSFLEPGLRDFICYGPR